MPITEKKNQHFVPKFLLKFFSLNKEEKALGMFITKTGIFQKSVSLVEQASKKYYYGEDGVVEDWLGVIEGNVKPIFSEIIENRNLPKFHSDNHIFLLEFIQLMNLRNPVEIEFWYESFNKIHQHLKEIDSEISEFDINQRSTMSASLSGLGRSTDYCLDLKCKILINKTNVPFIIGDNPSIKYNQFMEIKNYLLGGMGLACKGLQILMPLNPQTTILFYDSWAYKVGDKKKSFIELQSESEIFQLNALQLINCKSIVYFNEQVSESYIRKLDDYSKKFEKGHSHLHEVIGQGLLTGVKQSNIKLELANLCLTKDAKIYDQPTLGHHPRPFATAMMNIRDDVKPVKYSWDIFKKP